MKYFCYILMTVFIFPTVILAATIEGTITNGTTGKAGIPDEIVLKVPGMQGMKTENTIKSPRGTYQFTNLGLDGMYLLQVSYQGVIYNQHAQFAEGDSVVTLDFQIFETTPAWENVMVDIPHFIAGSVDGERLRVDRRFRIVNMSQKTIYQPGRATFVFPLPNNLLQPAAITATGEGDLPQNPEYQPLAIHKEQQGELFDLDDVKDISKVIGLKTVEYPIELSDSLRQNLYGIEFPIKPGETEINVVFDVPYLENEYTLTEIYPDTLHTSTLFIIPDDMQVEGKHLEFLEIDHERHFATYQLAELPPQTPLTIHFSGGTFGDGNGQQEGKIRPHPNSTTAYAPIIIFIMLAIMSGVMIFSYTHRPTSTISKENDNAFSAKKEDLLAQLAQLDDDFAEKKIDEGDYQRQRANLKNRLIKLLKETG